MLDLYKRVIVIGGKEPENTLVRLEQEASMVFVTLLLDGSNRLNCDAGSREPAFDAQSHLPLLPYYRPRDLVPDFSVLRALVSTMPLVADQWGWHNKVTTSIMVGWDNTCDSELPFPLPPPEEQLKGIYLITHHCCARSLAWTKQQRVQRNVDVNTKVDGTSSGHIAFPKDMQQLIACVSRNACVKAVFAALKTDNGEWLRRPWGYSMSVKPCMVSRVIGQPGYWVFRCS